MGQSSNADDSLRCSFCHKAQGAVGKLISSPSDYPRAYICDECIAVCAAIVEDDRVDSPAAAAAVDDDGVHPWVDHPAASELMEAVADWIQREALGQAASEDLARVRAVALRMLEAQRAEQT